MATDAERWSAMVKNIDKKIEGYNLISVGKTCSAHGGLAIYLNDEMKYKILNLYEQFIIWEGQFIEICKVSSSKKTYNR